MIELGVLFPRSSKICLLGTQCLVSKKIIRSRKFLHKRVSVKLFIPTIDDLRAMFQSNDNLQLMSKN